MENIVNLELLSTNALAKTQQTTYVKLMSRIKEAASNKTCQLILRR
jgi:hypothetical protein